MKPQSKSVNLKSKMIKLPVFPLIFLLLIASCTRNNDYRHSQHLHAPDSLWRLTGNANWDSIWQDAASNLQLDKLQKNHDGILYQLGSTDTEKAKEYCLKLKHLSEYLDWDGGRYLYFSAFADILISINLNDSALVFLQQALEFSEKEENETWKATTFLSMANAYVNKNWNNTALTYMLQALPRFEEINSSYLPYIYCNMGVLYRNIHLLETAIEYGRKAIDLEKENPYYLSQLGISLIHQHQYEEAKHYLEQALHHSILKNFTYLSGFIYTYLGNIAFLVYDLDNAGMYARKALEIFQNTDDISNYCANYILIGKVEQLRSHFAKSEEYIKEALKIASDTNDLPLLKSCYMTLSELSFAQHRFHEYIQYQREWELIESTIAKETSVLAAAEMSAKYETEKKELEIERQKSVIARANMQRGLLAAGIVVSIVFLVLLWRILHLRNRHNRALTELNRALDETNATKDKFFSIISHDLKNPAVAQRDAIRMLFDHATLWDTASLREYYGKLLQSADHQVELLYNLLRWAQLQTKRMTCQPEPFDFVQEIRSDLALAGKMADDKGVRLAVEMPPEAVINADSGMIVTVVRNLLTNAVKFTPAGGTVTLNVSPCKDAARHVSTNNEYTISITDTGVGMNSEELQNLFRLDRRHTSSGTSGETGTGLGLIVCRELLEKHGTKLHVESEEGNGSKFWFELKVEN